MEQPESQARPRWHRTGDVFFPVAAQVDERWWVLRANHFPDHPMWTVFVDGAVRFDIEDLPPGWGRPLDPNRPVLDPTVAHEVLAPVRNFVAYGSEVGRPCDNPFCCG